jgi:cyclopropane-fatty-acyl-phospholipid synthase
MMVMRVEVSDLMPTPSARAGGADALPASAGQVRHVRRAPGTAALLRLAERGLLPDIAIRVGIRRLLRQRLQTIEVRDLERAAEQVECLIRYMSASPMAVLPDKANEQHYELPAEFYRLVLGGRLKYSCGHWPSTAREPLSLDEAEAAALQLTCERARLADRQRVLELGCGWGSLTLWIAEHYPGSQITAVSNSLSQREYILEQAARRGLGNIIVIARDINEFDPGGARYDRVVSVEMFEHLRNWPEAFRSVHRWLTPTGLFFLHVFAHKSAPYLFEVTDSSDWMAEHFFSGGIMPSDDLALRVCWPLHAICHWRWSGTHYQRTAEGWLANLDAHRDEALTVLRRQYGTDAPQWLQRWRMFFMACAELFGYAGGQEWGVGHYLFAAEER